MPAGKEPCERCRIDWLHLVPESRQGPSPQEAQDVRVAPLTLGPTGPELAAQDGAGGQQPLQAILDDAERQAPTARRLRGQERPVGPGPARQQRVRCPERRLEERGRDPDRHRHADRVAIARDVLDRDPAFVARDPDGHGPTSGREFRQPGSGHGRAALGPRRHFRLVQIAEPAKQVVDAIERRGLAILGQGLDVQLEIGERLRIEQLAQLLLPQQLAQQVAVQRQRAGPAFGQRRIAVVHVGGDVVEQQAARERRGADGLHAVDRDVPPRDVGEDLAQRSQVEHVAQALAIGLDQDREAAIAAGDREQVRGSLALLPERRPGARPATWQEQRTGRVLAEPAGEQGGGRELADHQVFEFFGIWEEQRLDAVQRRVAFGQPDGDAVV